MRPDGAELPRQSHTELVIGLVAAIGTDLDAVAQAFDRELKAYAYSTESLRLSEFLPALSWPNSRILPRAPYDVRVWAAMDAGDDLRRDWERGDALALLAISAIERSRFDEAKKFGKEIDPTLGPPTIDRRAWILRSLKTPEEVSTMRDIYGPRFFLVGVHMNEDQRIRSLRAQIRDSRPNDAEAEWDHAPSQLIDRDWKEERSRGQNVSDTFSQSDFFVTANDNKKVRADIRRILRLIFGDPYVTPSRDEYAMFLAAGGARRSAEPGRQVGAAIVNIEGSVLSLGTNEVPRGGGGAYWEGDPDDRREFTLTKETNRLHQERITERILAIVEKRFDSAATEVGLRTTATNARFKQRLLDELPSAVMKEGRVGELTEFGRATHAEMSALLDCSRRGVAVQGASLMTYTFPCHNCARHIVEAGISRVVFVEPYAKSLALELHDDAIELSGRNGSGNATRPVSFTPFSGVAPRRYLQLFDARWREARGYPSRKDGDGRPIEFEQLMSGAMPVITDIESEDLRPRVPVYRSRERRAIDLLQEIFEATEFAMEEER
ncbi:MAG TPA: anti-phage dCTP deaminase [Conexibacter sp.]